MKRGAYLKLGANSSIYGITIVIFITFVAYPHCTFLLK